VARDRAGVPHVAAASMMDAAFAMGVVHAQDRLWQMEVTRRVALGRVSEFAGAEGLVVDRFIRRLGLHRVAAAEARTASAEVLRMLDAYAAGVNTVIGSGRPLPIEYRLLKLTPEPWQAEHSLAASKLLALGLSLNWDIELQRSDLLRAIGPERAALLDVVYPAGQPTILAQAAADTDHSSEDSLAAMWAEASRWIPSLGGASNSWVLAPERSTTGRPILCNDPHLTPSLPSIWYVAHVAAGSDFESTGVTMPGLPFVLIGHNRRIAWGFTNSFADSQDLVIEEFDSPAAHRYRTERGFEPTRLLREIIHVRDASDAIEEVVVTRHGPVVQRLEDPARSVWRGLSLQWTALTPGGAVDSMLRLQRAGDWEAFRDALAPLDAPSQNAVYADVEGHIGYLLCGRVPVRRRPPSGLPVAGWAGDALWSRFLRPDELPSVLDPEAGVIITANNRIVGDDFPHYISMDYMNGYRAQRIADVLSDRSHDLTEMARLQMDVLCLPAVEVASLLGAIHCDDPTAEKVRLRLAAWDGQMLAERVEPTLYEAFMRRLTEHALRPLCGDAWETAAGVDRSHPLLEYPVALSGRLVPSLLERWRRDDLSLFDGTTTWPEVVAAALRDAASDVPAAASGRRSGRWGRLHAVPLEHPFGQRPGLLRFGLDAGRVRVGGNLDTVMATAYLPRKPFATRLLAPSWRQVLDVGNWDACGGIHMAGQSGQPGSRHYRDLRGRWQRNRQLPLYWSAELVRRHTRSRLSLVPRSR
jgi:penicillin G amidase